MTDSGEFKLRVAYMDHNATAPVRPEAAAALAQALAKGGNASSVHGSGREARRLVEAAREDVAALVGARPAEVIFTAGGTEANNQALREAGRAVVVVSAVEHDSVFKARPDAVHAPVDADGIVDLAALESILGRANAPAIVSVMLANNETGVIQPISAVAALAHKHGALAHCDAVQAAGRVEVNMAMLGVDYLTLSAHKIGGAPGAGALIARETAPLASLIRGGGQERGMRAGTENVPAIAAFGAAARLARQPLSHLVALRDEIEKRLFEICPEARVFGASAKRLPNTTQISMPGVAAETQVIALDLDGVAVSAGSACSSGRVETPRVLTAMGIEEATAKCAIRISLGWNTTSEDVDRLIEAWRALYERTARKAA